MNKMWRKDRKIAKMRQFDFLKSVSTKLIDIRLSVSLSFSSYSRKKEKFIEKLICKYNLDSEIEEYLQTIENHAKITQNAPEIYVLQGELLRYLSNKNEQNDAIISYQVQNSDNENDEN